MQILDGEEGMLIDGVTMIKIADHESFDSLEFRQQQGQQAERVHGSERIGGMWLDERFLEVEP